MSSGSLTSATYKHFLMDTVMLTHLHVAKNVSYTTGEVVTGGSSGATAVVESVSVNHSATISSATNVGVLLQHPNARIRRWYASIIFRNINCF